MRVAAFAAVMAMLPLAAGADDTGTARGCAAGPAKLAAMQAAAGTDSPLLPADASIIDPPYSFVLLGTTATRYWPDKDARLDSLMQAGVRGAALCGIKMPGGTAWLVLRGEGGVLRYVPRAGTQSVEAHEADMVRMRKIWDARPGSGGEGLNDEGSRTVRGGR